MGRQLWWRRIRVLVGVRGSFLFLIVKLGKACWGITSISASAEGCIGDRELQIGYSLATASRIWLLRSAAARKSESRPRLCGRRRGVCWLGCMFSLKHRSRKKQQWKGIRSDKFAKSASIELESDFVSALLQTLDKWLPPQRQEAGCLTWREGARNSSDRAVAGLNSCDTFHPCGPKRKETYYSRPNSLLQLEHIALLSQRH